MLGAGAGTWSRSRMWLPLSPWTRMFCLDKVDTRRVTASALLTAFLILCSSLDECTFIVNGSDTFGGDDVSLDNSQLTGPCIFSRRLQLAKNWYGYIGNFTLRAHGAKLYFNVVYPEKKCCVKLLLYLEKQVQQLRYHMNCLQKQAVLDPMSPQVITLSPSYSWSGCTTKNRTRESDGERLIECSSGRILTSDVERTWYVAASSCGSPTGLDIEYTLVVYGYEGVCPHPSYFATDSAPTTQPTGARRIALLTMASAAAALVSQYGPR